MDYNDYLDNAVKQALENLTQETPCKLSTNSITDEVIKVLKEKKLNVLIQGHMSMSVGRSMRRLGHASYRKSTGRWWIVME